MLMSQQSVVMSHQSGSDAPQLAALDDHVRDLVVAIKALGRIPQELKRPTSEDERADFKLARR